MLFVLAFASSAFAGPYDIVVIRSGGPSPSQQAQEQIQRLVGQIAKNAGWPHSAKGVYFNDEAKGLAYIQSEKPGFVLSSPGFYLKHKVELKLTLLNEAVVSGASTITYFVVVKNQTATDLEGLKGKTLAGVHLEEPEFIQSVVFENRIVLGSDVKISVMRSLRALKKLDSGNVNAVILDRKEYDSMKSLPFADSLSTIFTSGKIPNTGFMTIGSNSSVNNATALKKAVNGFCDLEGGKEICTDFDIGGFVPVDSVAIKKLEAQYNKK